jgi:di/tricarboxylate transporter
MSATAAAPALSTPAMPLAWREVSPPATVAVLAAWAIWTLPQGLGAEARAALIVTVLAMVGWIGTRLPESLVALAAGLALVLTGTVDEAQLFATLGSELVWLLVAAFLIAAVVREAGLAERLVAPLTAHRPRVAGFLLVLSFAIALTALVIPSTSGRAALLLPVFVAILPLLPDARLSRAVALVFPTTILLSAGGSLIGAGAHLVAVEAIAATGGPRIGYLDWLILAGPLALLATLAGALLILVLFVPRGLWSARLAVAPAQGPRTAQQTRVLVVLLALVGLWLTEPLHGLGMALVAVVGALVLLTRPFTGKKTKDLFRAVDMELILYMAATMLIAQAMTRSGADRWLADQALAALPPGMAASAPGIAIALSVIAVVAHLAVASRSARAAILIPAVALPMANLGHDATLLILIAVMGTGFCQTLMSSAKPLGVYGLHPAGGFAPADLLRLALPLATVKTALLVVFALAVWPQQLAAPAAGLTPVATLSPAPMAAVLPVLAAPATAPQTTTPQTTAPAVLASPRPAPRPDRTLAPPPPRAVATKARRPAAPANPLALALREAERDLTQAGRQVRRDLDRLLGRF